MVGFRKKSQDSASFSRSSGAKADGRAGAASSGAAQRSRTGRTEPTARAGKGRRSPAAGRRLIDIGLHYETFMKKHFADKALPRPYADLNVLALKSMLAALEHPENTAWVNLFTPVEILQNFGINCLSIEMMASFLGGFGIEDWFINQSEADGMAPTLCSYHKCLIGAVDSGLMPPAAAAVTTSTVCDGNVQTFRRAASACRVPLTILDIPNEISPMAIAYVVE